MLEGNVRPAANTAPAAEIRRLLRQLISSSLLLLLTGSCSETKGVTMNPETYFSGQQLAAYNLARRGETERLLKAVKEGVDLNCPGQQRLTMLGFAVLTADHDAIVNLVRAGANPNQVIPRAGSPAILAITKHFNPPRTEAVAALLDAGYDPNQILGEGTPYLFYFVDYSHWLGLRLALQRGGNINVRRSNGESLLAYVVERGELSQARDLIAAGADVTLRSAQDDTALLAIEYHIRRGDPSLREVWREMLEFREFLLSKLTDPKDRRTVFTDLVEEKIRQNP
ncbi:ankyrin repeat domain-containing protein [Geomonas sp. RF6]|uniref:ankyrin repeat domain-containing protein n=1 Tax=Geomonas sp. RF6 TaxID=2897342 RepID=UPI001E521A6F|nr:ankyrin repeat domain-containing protein [Geomonas sp. RF6]UFS72075.1 ankyrin repeat domain-containing protein [Geomonas sp. RF6]